MSAPERDHETAEAFETRIAARWAARDAQRQAAFDARDARYRRENRRLLLGQAVFGLLGVALAGWLGYAIPMDEATAVSVGMLSAAAGIATGMVVAAALNRRWEQR